MTDLLQRRALVALLASTITVAFFAADFAPAHAQQWMRGPSLQREHYRTVATLLQDGRVLVTGGMNGSSAGSADCEFYDPLANTIRPAPSMNVPRALHSVVMLDDGRALAVGGWAGAGIASCELFDPVRMTWTPTGQLNMARGKATAVLLRDGRVLVCGGIGGPGGSDILASAELYDPATGRWTVTAPMSVARAAHAAVRLVSNDVLVVSGYPYSKTCEIYDPDNGTWRATAPIIGEPRGEHSLTEITLDEVLMCGGWGGTKGMLSDCAIYNPATETWRPASPLSRPRCNHHAIRLPNRDVLVVGGIDALRAGDDGSCYALSTTEIYDSASGTWSAGPTLPLEQSYFAATLLPTGLVWIGAGGKRNVGRDPESFHLASFLYDCYSSRVSVMPYSVNGHTRPTLTLAPNGKAWLVGGSSDCAGALAARPAVFNARNSLWTEPNIEPQGLVDHTASLLAISTPTLFVVGGRGQTGASDATYAIDLERSQTAVGRIPGGPRFAHTATMLFDGRLLILGGTADTAAPSIARAEWYRPDIGWDTADPIPSPRRNHTATLLRDGRVLVVGGITRLATATCWLYDPFCDRWTQTAAMSTPRTGHTATLLSDGTVLVAGGHDDRGRTLAACETYDPVTGVWSAAGSLATARAEHTASLLHTGHVVVIGGSDTSGASTASVEIFSHISRTWRAGGALTTARHNHATVVTRDGFLLVAGGTSVAPGSCFAPSSPEIVELDALNGSLFTTPNLLTATEDGTAGQDRRAWAFSGRHLTKHPGIGSGSNGSYNSALTDYPVVEMQRIGQDGGEDLLFYAPFDVAAHRWTDSTTYVKIAVGPPGNRSTAAGWYAARVVSDGLHSRSVPVLISYADSVSPEPIAIDSFVIHCDSVTFETSSPCAIENVLLNSAASRNVMLSVDRRLPADRVRVTVRSIDPDSTGHFVLSINNRRVVIDSIPANVTRLVELSNICSVTEVTITNPCGVEMKLDTAASRNVRVTYNPPPPATVVRATIRLINPDSAGAFTFHHGNEGQTTGTIPPRVPPMVAGPVSTCDTYTYTLSDTCGIENLALDGAASSNVTMDIAPPLPATSVTVTIRTIDKTLPGAFRLISGGRTIASGIIEPSGLAHIAEVDAATAFGPDGCGPVTFTNRSSTGMWISAASMRRNTAFSVPPSQLPLWIPAGESRELLVCFEAGSGEPFDTLDVAGDCSEAAISFKGWPPPALTGIGTDACGTAIAVRSIGSGKALVLAHPPVVQRDGSALSIFVERSAVIDQPDFPMSVAVYDMLGRPACIASPGHAAASVHDGRRIERLTYHADLRACPQGPYVLGIATADGPILFRFVLVR